MSKIGEFTTKSVAKLVEKNNHGYILKVNVDYPEELHDMHSKWLFLVEKMKISKVEKLMPSLNNKELYVVHLAALRQALKHGFMLNKRYLVMKFEQNA